MRTGQGLSPANVPASTMRSIVCQKLSSHDESSRDVAKRPMIPAIVAATTMIARVSRPSQR